MPALLQNRHVERLDLAQPQLAQVRLLQKAYELHLIYWAVGHRDLSPAMAKQAVLRLATFFGESDWTLI